jgi:hypothetical protein
MEVPMDVEKEKTLIDTQMVLMDNTDQMDFTLEAWDTKPFVSYGFKPTSVDGKQGNVTVRFTKNDSLYRK